MNKHIITLARNSRQLTAGQYVETINRVKASAPKTQFKESFGGWWPATREEILRQFGEMVTNKINERLPIRTLSDFRLLQLMKRHIKSDCRWCGSSLNRYEPKHCQFCDASCRRCHGGY
jgi:hypothetical protein